MKLPNFWDVVVVREDGEWVGFRAPWNSLRRTASFFSLVVAAAILATTGWLMSRWQVERLSHNLGSERLKALALETQLTDLKVGPKNGALGASDALSAFTLFPSLDSDELTSSAIEITDDAGEYDAASKELALKFELVRKPPREGNARFYWVALFHGPQGILVFPSALASRKGEPLLFHRGQAMDDVKIRRAVSARFKVGGFAERAESEPMFVSFLIYDNKGSLLLRKRDELLLRRAGVGPKGAATE